MKVSDAAVVKVNFVDADFWLVRKGSIEKVGTPTYEFTSENIGIKANQELILPRYMYHMMLHLHSKGVFKLIALGTLNLKHIRIADVKNLPI